MLFQPRLEVDLAGWHLRGDVDLVRLHRREDSVLEILVADLKSTTEVKVEHRLQVAFYRLMLERIFGAAGIRHDAIRLGILHRPPIPSRRTYRPSRPRSQWNCLAFDKQLTPGSRQRVTASALGGDSEP